MVHMQRFALTRLRVVPIAACLFAVALTFVIVGAQRPDLRPRGNDQITALIVAELLKRQHLSKPQLNDDLSARWYDNYLEALDPRKDIFLKADVDEFVKSRLNLDDQIQARDNLSFAFEVFDRYLERREQRFTMVEELLAGEFDFSIDETIAADPELMDYPADDDEARDRWRKRLKLDLLQYEFSGTDLDKSRERLLIRYRDINRRFNQFDEEELLETYLGSLTRAIDPHSDYWSDETWQNFSQVALELNLEGIGATLRSEDGLPVVEDVVPGGAADKDGRLQPEDRIVGIELDEEGETLEFAEMKLTDVVQYIRGKRGTKIRLIVVPRGMEERRIYELIREKINLVDQRAKSVIHERPVEGGEPVRIGVIKIPTFYGNSPAIAENEEEVVSVTEDCRRILRSFSNKDVDVVLIDLQYNGGGLLLEAIELSGLFIDRGPVVQVRNAAGIQALNDENPGTAWDGPMAVLINKQSASASEIFAGVIKDYQRGLIIGDSSTFGKGTVQTILPINEFLRDERLPALGALKVTVQQFYRANGESTQIEGVKPDILLPTALDFEDFGEETAENALAFNVVPEKRHDRFALVIDPLVERLRARSEQRREANDEFQTERERREVRDRYRDVKQIPLSREKYRERYLALSNEENRGKTEEQLRDEARKRRRQVWPLDYYKEEVLTILADYYDDLKRRNMLAAVPIRNR